MARQKRSNEQSVQTNHTQEKLALLGKMLANRLNDQEIIAVVMDLGVNALLAAVASEGDFNQRQIVRNAISATPIYEGQIVL